MLEREIDQPIMLAIRLQRTGRKGLAHYRVIVQEAQKSPKSGRVVARIGHYNPHTKEIVVDKEQAEKFMKNGAQPSDKVARLFKAEKIKLPDWVAFDADKKRTTKNTEKLRKHQPAKEEVKDEPTAEKVDESEVVAEAKPSDTPSETTEEVKESPAEADVAVAEPSEPAKEDKPDAVDEKTSEQEVTEPEAVEPADVEVADSPSEETSAEKKEEKSKA